MAARPELASLFRPLALDKPPGIFCACLAPANPAERAHALNGKDKQKLKHLLHRPAEDAGRIDVVYLWVNGADPVWLRKRHRAYTAWTRQNGEELAAFGNVAGRYRDNSELLFNLRALELFFPDHGHVYIVTDGQTPAWLRPSSQVTLVDHRQLLPCASPEVFDSGHIESYLHHIPGLSERFIYLNDDVFFGQQVNPAWWFEDRIKVFLEPASTAHPEALHPGEYSLDARADDKRWKVRIALPYVAFPAPAQAAA